MNEEHYKEQLFLLWVNYWDKEEFQNYEDWKAAMLRLLKESFDDGYIRGQEVMKDYMEKRIEDLKEELYDEIRDTFERLCN